MKRLLSRKLAESKTTIFLARLWSDEKLRFIFVGGINTFFGFLIFSIVQYFWGTYTGAIGSLYIAHIIWSTFAFLLYRRFVFLVTGNFWPDFGRFQSVYIVPLLSNTFLLPVIILVTGWNPYIAQAVSLLILTLVSYFGHKFFSFGRKTSHENEPDLG